jgi:hypothetical protein
MTEVVTHTALTMHSVPFSLNGGTTYSVSLTGGTVADGADQPELQRLVNGAWVSLDPPIRVSAAVKGGMLMTSKLPAGSTFRWTVPPTGHSINTRIVGN